MTISKGERIPSTTFTKMTENGPEPVSSDHYIGGKTVAIFSVPGAFTPTCSAKHLPGFIEKAAVNKPGQLGVTRGLGWHGPDPL